MRSDPVVVIGMELQSSAQMCLAQDNDVVQTLAPDRSDQPFGKAVLPRRSWRDRLVPDAHGAQSTSDDGTVDPIAIPDQVTRSFILGERLGDLTSNPLRCRVGGNIDPDQIPAIKPYNHEAIQQLKADGRDLEQIHGGDVRRVVSQKSSPSLTWWPASLDHVLGDTRLR